MGKPKGDAATRRRMAETPDMWSSIDHLALEGALDSSMEYLDDEPYFSYDARKHYVPSAVKYYLTGANGRAIRLTKKDESAGISVYRLDGEWVAHDHLDVPADAGTAHVTENAVDVWDRFKGKASVRAFANTNLDNPVKG
ncbi:hypothetical protein [Arthrobacter sp. N199823]|uniref:hypothetical protein n=1 Tax=Arthrobacter sp. N199823 TaxID=2058895 RepID=UPI0011B0A2FC|nr:hypothetical protein [Arthrobacter sp. N199823]